MEIVLLWCFVLAWMAKRGAEDLVHAVKGTPNPRYELKKQRAAAAGQSVKGQPRYGTREWLGDLYSDALAAHTEKRRTAAKAKAAPIDDLAEAVREDRHPHDPNNTRNCPACKGEVVLDGRPCPHCLAEQERRNAEWDARIGTPVGELDAFDQLMAGPPVARHETPEPAPRQPEPKPEMVKRTPVEPRTPRGVYDAAERFTCANCGEERYPAGRKEVEGQGAFCLYCQRDASIDESPTARIIQFPNPKQIEKEITMPNSEATGLATAIAFAEQAATAHTSFATTGAEGYVGALERGGMGAEPVGSAREAMEASGIAADKWAAHKATLEAQMNLREAYQSQPDAADKEYLLAE